MKMALTSGKIVHYRFLETDWHFGKTSAWILTFKLQMFMHICMKNCPLQAPEICPQSIKTFKEESVEF